MSEHQFNIKSEPFSWDDNFSEVALEDFYMIQKNLPYTIAQYWNGVRKIKND